MGEVTWESSVPNPKTFKRFFDVSLTIYADWELSLKMVLGHLIHWLASPYDLAEP